jgi:hypothetical protein
LEILLTCFDLYYRQKYPFCTKEGATVNDTLLLKDYQSLLGENGGKVYLRRSGVKGSIDEPTKEFIGAIKAKQSTSTTDARKITTEGQQDDRDKPQIVGGYYQMVTDSTILSKIRWGQRSK